MASEESRISNLSIEKQDDGDIRCPNCSWYFSTNTKPYILPCFHNLCDKCINLLIQQKKPKCPICSTIFTTNETNPFQVNFAYLNIVTKILANKIIFCKKCDKVFYWIEHYTICGQENFIEGEEIYKEIKNSCEKGIKILRIFNGNNNNILIKYKSEIITLLEKLLNKIRKQNIIKIKKEIKKLFDIINKEKLELNYEDIKKNIINFILISINQSEYININNNLIKEVEQYILLNKKSIYLKNNNKIFNGNQTNKTQRNYNSSNITITKQKNKYLKKKQLNSSDINNNNNKIILAKTPNNNNLSSDINFATNLKKSYNIKSKIIIQDKKIIENKNKSDSEEELINNFDDDYHDNETDMCNNDKNDKNGEKMCSKKNFSDLNYIPPNKLKEFGNIKNKKIKNKDIFEKSLLQDTKTEKKLIIGLNEIKVISLKKKISNDLNKSNSENIIIKKINKNKINKNKLSINNRNNEFILRKGNENKDCLTKSINSISNLNILISSDLTKNKSKLFINKKLMKSLSPKKNPNSNINHCCISLNDINNLKIFNNNKKTNLVYINNSNNKIIKKKPFINANNTNKINNTNKEFFDNITNKNKNIYTNNLSNPNINNKSMNAILQNFNNIKDIITKINKYIQITKYINNSINNKINHNISLLKENISQDYYLLLDDVVNNFCYIQRKYLFSFKNNTKFIILFDIEYNNFIPLDLSDVLNNYPQFNSSMQFEFTENSDKYLLFITGGNQRIIKEKENYSSDTFLIINIKLNINLNDNNKINYKKKYIIEYEDKMPSAKSYHSILYYNKNLYIIGGFDNNKKASNECYYFSYENKKWENLPNLNIPRANCSICIYNKSILYLFRGRNNECELNSIEYLNINEKKKWEIINVIDYGYIWNNIYNSCTVILNENQILIFGGEDGNKLYKDSIIFDIKNKNVYRGMDMKIPAAFNGNGIFNNGKIYGFDFKNKNGDYKHKIHIFDLKNNYWSLI